MSPMASEIIQIRPAAPEDVVDLRHRVLRAGLPRALAVFEGDHEPETRHLVAVLTDGTVVGCVTYLRRPPPFDPSREAWQLRGMAVAPSLQGRGVGARLLVEGERTVVAAGADLLWCNARTPAVPFYRKHGWEPVGEEFEIETAGPHQRMRKALTTGRVG